MWFCTSLIPSLNLNYILPHYIICIFVKSYIYFFGPRQNLININGFIWINRQYRKTFFMFYVFHIPVASWGQQQEILEERFHIQNHIQPGYIPPAWFPFIVEVATNFLKETDGRYGGSRQSMFLIAIYCKRYFWLHYKEYSCTFNSIIVFTKYIINV